MTDGKIGVSDSNPSTSAICPMCGLQLHKASLKRHMIQHSDLRPYVCPACSRRFKRKDYLESHLRTHRNRERALNEFKHSLQ